MKKLNLFIPITKVDEENRLVYGTIAAEEVDNSGEIFDYESSRPNFEKWSDAQFEASNGLSKGNVRAMHTAIAAGKLTDISYDDDTKTIEGCAKVVDEGEWQKVLEGVYTGFSMGGRYEKRWNDNGTTRYTAQPVEVSLVDKPCIKSATFDGMKKSFLLQKADGTTEERAFKADWNEDDHPRDEKGQFAGGGASGTGWTDNPIPDNERFNAGPSDPVHGGSDPTGHGSDNAKATTFDHGQSVRTSYGYGHIMGPGKEEGTHQVRLSSGRTAVIHESNITKSDEGDITMYVPTNDEILPVAQGLAKAAGKTDADWLEFVEPATAQLVAEKGDNPFTTHSDENCKVDNCDKCADKAAKVDVSEVVVNVPEVIPEVTGAAVEPGAEGGDSTASKADVVIPDPEQGWKASDGTFFSKKADCKAHNEKLAKGDTPPTLAASLDDALAVVGALAKGETVVADAPVEEPVLGKSIDTQLLDLAGFIAGPELRKGLYDVSRFTDVLRSAANIYSSARNEAARESDSSTVPAAILEGINTLGQALIDMATEEVGEMLTELREAGESDETYCYPESCYLSAQTMGLEKADADEFFTKAIEAAEKRGPRLAKAAVDPVQPVEDELSKAVKAAGFDTTEAFVAGLTDLQKAAGELAEIKPKVEELTKFIDTLKTMPRPPAPTTSVVVEKGIDANPASVNNGGAAMTDLQKAEQLLAGLSPEQISQLAIKASHASGGIRLSLNQ